MKTADEIRKIMKYSKESIRLKILNRIDKQITESAKHGLYTVSIYLTREEGTLKSELIKILKENGYTIKTWADVTDTRENDSIAYCLEISWNEK